MKAKIVDENLGDECQKLLVLETVDFEGFKDEKMLRLNIVNNEDSAFVDIAVNEAREFIIALGEFIREQEG